MYSLAVFVVLLLLRTSTIHAQISRSSKRGLIYISSSASTTSDNKIWTSFNSDLTWYYNYQADPTSDLEKTDLQFVPMLFGAPTSDSQNNFLDSVNSQLDGGANITAVLGFNEPDGQSSTGGSDVTATLAAQTWIREIEPLKKKGLKLGAPAVTAAPSGFTWLQQFFTACAGKCSADFVPVHWYGEFQGLASHIGQVRATYPNMSIWVTEWADPNNTLNDTQSSYNESASYMDRTDYVDRYSYFGSFRSDVSNVGPNVAMLTQSGELTDIGSWYLGGSATGNVPNSASLMKAFVGWWSMTLFVWLV